MDRGFFPRRPRFRRRCHDRWFNQNYMSNENFWLDTWDMPQDQFPEGLPPWWNQHHPEQEGPYNVGFDNYTQGSYHRRPYRGRPYRRFKKTSSKGRGNFQNPSSSRFLNNVPPKKTFKKVKEQAEDSKKFKQDKENTATSVKKDFPSKVKPKDSQPDEESPRQTDSVASPEAVAEEESPSGIKKIPPHTQNEDIVLDKLKDCEATEDLLSQMVSILSPGVSTEDKTSSCNADVLQNIEEKDSVLQQASQSAQDSSHVFSPTAVEIPFLSENANDDQSERSKDIELIETSAKQNDTDDSQANVVAPALDSSSLPSTPIDIHCEPVLVTEKDNELIETSAKQTDTDDSQAYAVAPALDSSSLPSTPIDVHCEPVLVRGNDTGLIETSDKQTDTDDSQAYVSVLVTEKDNELIETSAKQTDIDDSQAYVSVLVTEKDNELIETSAKQNDTDDSQAYVAAPTLDSSSLPSTPIDVHCEPVLVTEKDNELTETSAKQNDTDDSQAYVVAPALDSSSLSSSLNDICCVPVLVRGKDTGLTETSAKENDTDDSQANVVAPVLDSSSLPSTLNDIRSVPVLVRRNVIGLAENQTAWAPEDYQEPPWSVNQADQYLKVSERYKDSVSTSISSNEKHNIESLAKSKSSSPKIHHSINSKHSNTNKSSRDLRCQSPRSNKSSRDLRCQSPRSYARQKRSSRSSGKRDPSTERQDRSSKLSCSREHSSGSSHKQEDSPQREKRRSKSPYRQEQSSQKRGCSPKTSLVQEHGVKSVHKRKRSSNSPPKRKRNSKSQKLDRCKEKKLGRSCCHCYYHYQESCNPSQESLCHRCCSPSYLTCKIEHLNVSKEIRNVYGMPYHLSPKGSIANEKEVRESRQVVEPKIPLIEKEKRATSRTRRKALKSSTKKEKTSSPCHLNAEEETNSSVPSWTPKDRSAAVLARKEELEQAYLQVLLNFGVIAIMLVEKEPCMIEAMNSALRANLRKIGDYYECLLRNYIDSLTEAS